MGRAGKEAMKIFPLAVVTALAFPSIVDAEWRFAWQVDEKRQDYSCSIFSETQRVRTGAGSEESSVQLGIGEDSSIILRSDAAPFDPDALATDGISVDDHPAVKHPERSRDGRTLSFSSEDSFTLHRQFEEGSTITATMVFARGKPLKQQFSLAGYRTAVEQYKGCWGLLYSPGWMGLFTTEAIQDPERISLIKKNASYPKHGIIVVTVDPKKEAYKNDLRPGDRIVKCNGQEVEVKDLVRIIKNLDVGASIELNVVRDGIPLTKTITRPNDASR